jgi:hypothetical protein
MQKTKAAFGIAFILCVLVFLPTILFGNTIYFDSKGNAIEKSQHVQIAAERERALSMELSDGYSAEPADWKDPIKLRQHRIEQWKNMRSMYHPGSLPSKIEDNAQTRQ